jgi:hypothetical protein
LFEHGRRRSHGVLRDPLAGSLSKRRLAKRLSHYSASSYAEPPFVLRIARIARKRRNRPSLSFAGPSFEHKKDGFEFDEQTEAEVENPEAKQVIEQPAPVFLIDLLYTP